MDLENKANYIITGKVIHGRHVGTKMGFPTANIDYGNQPLPENGVYMVYTKIDDKFYLSMANIGYNPTVNLVEKKSLEVNIFDFSLDIYDKIITIYFIDFIRPEKKFSNMDELITQLNNDKDAIKKKAQD